MKSILKYLKTLDADTLFFVIQLMGGGVHTDTGDGCSGSPPATGPTPNGYYVCRNGVWTWVPTV